MRSGSRFQLWIQADHLVVFGSAFFPWFSLGSAPSQLRLLLRHGGVLRLFEDTSSVGSQTR